MSSTRSVRILVALAVACLCLTLGAESRSSHRSHHRRHSAHRSQSNHTAADLTCLGEFELCPNTGDCVLIADWCGTCSAGQYLCPDGKTCVADAKSYQTCPGLSGTHLDWTLPIEERIAYFLKAAELQDKIDQLQNQAPAIPYLGVPFYNWLNDDVHSVNQHHATVFPNGCGLGATWDKQVLFDVGYLIGNEARATHNGKVHAGDRGQNENAAGITTYAPNINLVRDPRWGRNQEVYSEDPFLTGRLATAYVTGQQGANETETPYRMASSCCKHYAAYDVESNPVSRVNFNAIVKTRDFWESYIPAFEACVVDAGVQAIMCSYNSMNGVPTCADPNLLNGILRGRWNFTGFVVSDYDAWANLVRTHHVCEDMVCAASMGINAGMDQEGGGNDAIGGMAAAIQQGLVTEETVDQALARLLRVRIMLGMFDPPTLNPWNQLQNTTVESQPHLNLARDAARKSICLYKNDNQTLPMNPQAVSPSSPTPIKIALIGPQVVDGDLLYGNYAKQPDGPSGVISIVEGFFQVLGLDVPCTTEQDYDYYQPGETPILTWSAQECAALCSTDPECNFYTYYQQGCYLKANNTGGGTSPGRVSGACNPHPSITTAFGCQDILCPDDSGFSAALEVAEDATHVIVTLGLDARTIETEGHDRSDINLPGFQYQLVSQLRVNLNNSSQKLICLFIHGGTFALQNLLQDCDAIVDAWYPGAMGGLAIADVLFGSYNPGGRTAATWYAFSNDLPDMGQMSFYPDPTVNSDGITYRYYQGTPALAFGSGLSYTQFSYANFQTNGSSVGACDWIGFSVEVSNIGPIAGDEVVQLYLTQNSTQYPSPSIQLVGFERVFLQPTESLTVTFVVEPKWHSVVYEDGFENFWQPTRAVEEGQIMFYVGGGQPGYANTMQLPVVVTSTSILDQC